MQNYLSLVLLLEGFRRRLLVGGQAVRIASLLSVKTG